jgi:TetR/AcrR family transcriptional regulator, transcriptional repressor for nem operon
VRYPAGHGEQTRARILSAASERFRERGYEAVGVDAVMASAGLTAGGFYKHFSSKEALLDAALEEVAQSARLGLLFGLDQLTGPQLLRALAGRYLSRSHRDSPQSGCPLPSLAAEVARAGKGPRQRLGGYIESLARELGPRVPAAPGLPPEDRVLAAAALFVGGILLARAVPEEGLSDRILRACRRLAVPELAAEAEAERQAQPEGKAGRGAPHATRSKAKRARTASAARSKPSARRSIATRKRPSPRSRR